MRPDMNGKVVSHTRTKGSVRGSAWEESVKSELSRCSTSLMYSLSRRTMCVLSNFQYFCLNEVNVDLCVAVFEFCLVHHQVHQLWKLPNSKILYFATQSEYTVKNTIFDTHLKPTTGQSWLSNCN